MDPHKEVIKNMYKQKRDIMLDSMEKYLPKGVSWTKPDGGLFIWVTLPKNMNSKNLLKNAIEQKVAFVPGQAFATDNNISNTLRLNFSNASDENIVEGIKRLGRVINTELEKNNYKQ